MLKQLSCRNYLIKNIKKVLINIIIVSLSIALLYFLQSVPLDFFEVREASQIVPFEGNTILVYEINDKKISQNTLEQLKKIRGVNQVLEIKLTHSRLITAFIDNMDINVFYVNKTYMDYFLGDRNVILNEGRYPNSDNEILLPDKLLRSRGLKIGDSIGRDVNDEDYIEGNYKIVGSLKGAMEGYAFQKEVIDDIEGNSNKIYISCNENNRNDIVNEIKETFNNLNIRDSSIDIELTKNIVEIFFYLMQGLIILVNIFLFRSINFIRLDGRKDAMSFINTLGYKKSEILKMIVKEECLIIVSSIILGVLVSLLSIEIYNLVYAYENGMDVVVVNNKLLLMNSILPIVLLISNIISSRKYIYKKLTIETIEN